MFEFVRTHTRLLQFLLVLLIFPSFVFFGIQGYSGFTDAGNDAVAQVAGSKITRAELDAAHRDQIERVRSQMPNLDTRLFDTPEMRQQTLDALVRERVMLVTADKLNLTTTTERLQRELLAVPQLAALKRADGSFDTQAYKALLQAQGMTPESFEARVRQDTTLRQVMLGVGGTVFAPEKSAETAIDALLQQREVQVQRFDAKNYLGKVNPSDAELEAYYKNPANAAQFQAPEQATIEYALLDLEALKKGVSVSEDELRKYYAENEKRFGTPQERRASHILVKADKSAPAAEREKARAKADKLLAELRKNPASFAELARKNSDDPGSAERGGDLDFFARGAMVKPFEDAAFGLKQGEISGIVESDFGYHIIQVTGVRGGEKKSFDAVRAEIADEVAKQLAQRRYSEAALEFTNLVYEQSDSLKPVADKFKLELRNVKNVRRTPGPETAGPLASAKFLEALFGSDALRNKRNTEAVEIAPNQMVSGRVLEYTPAHQRPFAEVKDAVRSKVAAEQAAALARKEGEARLAQLKAAPDSTLSETPLTLSRAQTREQPRALVDAVLQASAATLPGYLGVELGTEGYAVVKLIKVLGRDPAAGDAARAQSQYAQAWGDAESQAYYAALKTRLRVETTPVVAAASAATN
jgi:peptidyl-prolyl cis-trans isomerase D